MKNFLYSLIFCFLLVLIQPIDAFGQSIDEKQRSFEWVFGDYVKLDPEMVQKVLTDTHGKRHYVDSDGDGKPEEVWFIDIDPRHTASKRPILVRVIDEDGDLEMGEEPDFDSDLYIADWNADGKVDAVVGYEDLDGDQDVDQMGMYFYDPGYGGLRVWWGRDDGDDNLLWYDVDYYYYQNPCQNNTHFGGDESFVSLFIKPGEKYWTSFFENPFIFYDLDKDGITEEVLRVSGLGTLVQSVRWGYDLDDDATIDSQRDFDVSMSAYAPGWTLEKDKKSDFTFYIGEKQGEVLTIRGIPTTPILKKNIARDYMRDVTWARVLMTWDENDLNKAWDTKRPDIERWESIIAAPSTDKGFEFPVIGGPDCGPYNKRYELLLSPKGSNEYYFNPADRRIHTKFSDRTWLRVDFDFDNVIDMVYYWVDTDHDGITDKVELDVDGNGKIDDSWVVDISQVEPLSWKFKDLNRVYAPVIKKDLPLVYIFNNLLSSILESQKQGKSANSMWDMLNDKMQCENLTSNLSRRLLDSDESVLYYLRLAADQRIANLKQIYKKKGFWNRFYDERSKGNIEGMMNVLCEEFKVSLPTDNITEWLAELRTLPQRQKVAWDNTWLPPNWGWESEKAAFRCYNGHFDIFGKRTETLIYPTIKNGKNYHVDESGWGMDILHVGKTGGIGGLILYVDDIAYPIRNEGATDDPVFEARLLKETENAVTIEFTVKGVGPKENPYTVYIRPSAIADRSDSPFEVYITGGDPQHSVKLGIVLNTLSVEEPFFDKSLGFMGLWGFQEPGIGWIGTGVIFPADRFLYKDDDATEHRVVLEYEIGETLTYHIQGDWLRAHTFNRSPGVQAWINTLKEKAKFINLK